MSIWNQPGACRRNNEKAPSITTSMGLISTTLVSFKSELNMKRLNYSDSDRGINTPGAGDKLFSRRGLTLVNWLAYRCRVAPQWVTGRGNPSNRTATTDAPCVFFYVATNATKRHFTAWCVAASTGINLFIRAVFAHHVSVSMVAQAGQLSGWPVLVLAGISTPVWAIAIERGNSGDSITCYRTEVAIMASTPISSHPQFIYFFDAICRNDMAAGAVRVSVKADTLVEARQIIKRDYVAVFYHDRKPVQPSSTARSSHQQFTWLFLAVRRSDVSAKPHRKEVTAPDFMSARRTLARDFVLSFAGRIPVCGVAHG